MQDQQRERTQDEPRGGPANRVGHQRRLALLNQKGGVGKTTTAVNLAAAMARAGQRVLLIDLDSQSHATLHLGVELEHPAAQSGDGAKAGGGAEAGAALPTVYDVLHEPALIGRAIRAARDRLDLLPADTDLAAIETELAAEPDRYQRLRQALDLLGSDAHDVVLMDCPPSLGLLTLSALASVDAVIVPMQAHFLSLQGLGKLLESVSLVRERLNPSLMVAGVVLCMFDSQATHTQEVVSDIRAFFDEHRSSDRPWKHARIFEPAIRRNIKLAEGPSFGQTIFEYAPQAAGADDYTALAQDVLAWACEHAEGRPSSPEPPVVEVVAGRSQAQGKQPQD